MQRTFSIAFCGTPAFAVPPLHALLESPLVRVDLVITQPDKPTGRSQKMTSPPVKELALHAGIPVVQPRNINSAFKEGALFVKGVPDFFIVVAYGQIFSQALLDAPKIAPINVHASLLPRWRGASPIQHALLANDRKTGISIQRMVAALDEGPILAQATTKISPRETSSSLHNRLSAMGAELLIETLNQPLLPQPQQKDGVIVCTKLSRKDGIVDPATMTAEEIDRRVRALVPWPGVSCTLRGGSVKVLETSLTSTSESISLPCAHSSTLFIERLQSPGKKPMTGREWGKGKHHQ